MLSQQAVTGGPVIGPNFHIAPLEPGDHVPNVSRWLGRVGIQAALTPGLATRGMVRFSGPYTPIGEPAVETRSYAVIDLGTSIQMSPLGAVLDLEFQKRSTPSTRRYGRRAFSTPAPRGRSARRSGSPSAREPGAPVPPSFR